MNDGRGMLSPDSFTEERLDMLPDSVPVLLVLWNRYHNVCSQAKARGFKTDSRCFIVCSKAIVLVQ